MSEFLFPELDRPFNEAGFPCQFKNFEEQDAVRLAGQAKRVFELMSDGKWRTFEEINSGLGNRDSEAGISARLRDFRKPEFGGHTVNRRRRSGGLFEYQLVRK